MSRRVYRYRVTASDGEGKTAVGDSPFVLDWKYLGREYTWNIFGGPKMEPRGFFTGEYVDKGYIVAGQYKADAELARPLPAASSSSGGVV